MFVEIANPFLHVLVPLGKVVVLVWISFESRLQLPRHHVILEMLIDFSFNICSIVAQTISVRFIKLHFLVICQASQEVILLLEGGLIFYSISIARYFNKHPKQFSKHKLFSIYISFNFSRSSTLVNSHDILR